MTDEAQKLLDKLLDRVQSSARMRMAVGVAMVAALLGIGGYFIYDLIPRQYSLSITGGDILGNRHYLTKLLQEEAEADGIHLRIRPTHGSFQGLDLVESGELDLAFVQGGLKVQMDNIEHVATVGAELLHFLVRPGIESVGDIRGKIVNLGSERGGTRVVASQVLDFSGLVSGVDFVETHRSPEDLVNLRPDRLPDVVVHVSFSPSYLADFLVKKRGYQVLELPFPEALSVRRGWVAGETIPAYMYGVVPPVPARNIMTVGVNLHLVANKSVEPRAVFAVLESLYGPSLASRLGFQIDEAGIKKPSGFPISKGTLAFLDRHDPLLSAKTFEKLQSWFGLAMAALSTLLVVVKWFKGPPPKRQTDDRRFKDLALQVAAIERELATGTPDRERLEEHRVRLAALKAEALEAYPGATLADPAVVATVIAGIEDTRARLAEIMREIQS